MLTAKYECKFCRLGEREIAVRERFQNENLQAYMDYLGSEAQQSHRILSPVCGARTVNLYIPMSSNGFGFAGDPLTPEEQAEVAEQLRKPKGE